jgi:hypothetical protein
MAPLIEYLHALAIAILVGKVVLLSFVVAPVLARVWSGSRSVQSFAGCFRPTRSLSDIKGEMGSHGGLAR